ncbi:hypothetical protein NF552_18125 [Roseomonas mucosa]|nr:hypothetical protein NF552_18125 [Roseomonas mucosa]
MAVGAGHRLRPVPAGISAPGGECPPAGASLIPGPVRLAGFHPQHASRILAAAFRHAPSIPPGPAPAASGHPGPAQPPPRAAEMDFALLAAVDHAMADLRAAVNAPQPAAGSLSELLRGIANATTPSPFSPDQR